MDFEEKRKTGISSILTYVIIFYILSALIQTIVKSVYVGLGGNNVYVFNGLIQLVIYICLVVPLVILNKKILKEDTNNLINSTIKAGKSIFIPFLIGFAIMYGCNIFQNVFVQTMEGYGEILALAWPNNPMALETTSDNQTYIVKIFTDGGFSGGLFMFLAAVVFGPLVEELVYRKSIFSFFKEDGYAVIISSLLFGLIHVVSSFGKYNLYSIIVMYIPYVISGFAFCLMYVKNNRNILISTVVHILSNAISIIMILITMK